MHRYQRYYIWPKERFTEVLGEYPHNRLSDNLKAPVCFGVGEGGFPGNQEHDFATAKILFLLWLFQNYGLQEDTREVFELLFTDFTISEATFDDYFSISTGTQVGRKMAVNSELFIKKQLGLETLESLSQTEDQKARWWLAQLTELKLRQRRIGPNR